MINSKITHPYTAIYQIDHIYNIFPCFFFRSLCLSFYLSIFSFSVPSSDWQLCSCCAALHTICEDHLWIERKNSTREKLHTKWIRQIECVRINKAVCKRQMWSLAAISQFLKAFSTSRQDFKFTTLNNLVLCRLHSIALARGLYISIGIQ